LRVAAWLDLAIALTGTMLITTGVATWSVPAALVALGTILLGLAVLSRLVSK